MTFKMTNKLSSHLLGLLIGAGLSVPVNALAAPGNLADEPLFLTNKAEPNIFFMVDDSGSMDFEMATDEGELSGVGGSSGAMRFDLGGDGDTRYWGYFYIFDASDPAYTTLGENGYTLPTQESLDALSFANYMTGAWRGRNHNYNRMYYNPQTTYKPWPGLNDAGVAFPDAYIHATTTWETHENPYVTTSTTIDLTADRTVNTRRPQDASEGTDDVSFSFTYKPARYWFWDDTNSNNVVDATDSKTLVEIKSTNTKCSGGLSATVAEQKTGCMLRDYADEMKNFANWFTYYRRREYAAKNALADVAKNSNGVRMGIATINENNSCAGCEEMASMNPDITSGNKKTLADSIFKIQSGSSTPLLKALEESGNYFEGSGGTAFGPNKLALDTSITAPATTSAAQCSQNFTVLMTDGFYNDSITGYGDADTDASSWTGDYDPDNDGTTVSNTFTFDGPPYASADLDNTTTDDTHNTLADIAMYFYERDLRTSTANEVPIRCGLDENPGQHMVTYTVAFGVNGNIDPSTLPAHPRKGYADSCTATTGSAFTWTDPRTNTGKIDDLIHAAYNGRGEYLNASNPTELSNRLTEAFRSITSRIGAASGVTFNTNVLNSNAKLYRARFNSTQWSGELEAIGLDAYGNLATTPDWEAGSVLDARDITSDERVIVTYKPSTHAAVAFRWANLDTSQQNDLKTDSTGTAETTTGFPVANARLAFIRGDRNCEIGATGTCSVTKEFRARSSRLGDLIHSQPIYSGIPLQSWPEEAPFGVTPENYSAYRGGLADASAAFSSGKTVRTRTEMLYIGGNDGMLHAFNASNGQEVYTYIPSMLYSSTTGYGLHALSEPGYSHKYYVDHSPTISEAYIDTGSGDNWHTVLVGGLRGGGRGFFALNITDPDAVINASGITNKETAVKNQVMWEFTNADDADLGYSFSRASIVPLGTSSGVEWYVVFGNGYNADTSAGADGESKLFILKLEGPGVDNTWDLGTDYFKITTEKGDTADINGLSTPITLDMNGDGITDRAYAGDLHGYMWAFNLDGSSGWGVDYATAGKPAPLFTASTGDAGAGTRQPITVKPAVTIHPSVATAANGSNAPNVMVYFGTGQYLASGDLSNTTTQSFYAVWDQGDKERTVHRSDITNSANHLVKKAFVSVDSLTRAGGSETVDYTVSGVYGWYYDLPETGERVVTNPTARNNLIFFNTLIPSLEPCGYGGSGWELALQTDDGSSSQIIYDTNGDGVVDSNDSGIAGTKKVGSVPMESSFIGGGGGGTTPPTAPTVPSGCPALVEPALQSCPSGMNLVVTYPLDGSGCPVKTHTCASICPPGTSAVTRWTTNSDGTQTSTFICVDSTASHTGRFNWRELIIE